MNRKKRSPKEANELMAISYKFRIPPSFRLFLSGSPEYVYVRECTACGKKKTIAIAPPDPWWDRSNLKTPADLGKLRVRQTTLYYECPHCRIARIQREMDEKEEMMDEIVDQNMELLDQCKKGGTCDILAAHHEILKDDPERLSTDFLIGMVCGKEKLANYHSDLAERISGNEGQVPEAETRAT